MYVLESQGNRKRILANLHQFKDLFIWSKDSRSYKRLQDNDFINATLEDLIGSNEHIIKTETYQLRKHQLISLLKGLTNQNSSYEIKKSPYEGLVKLIKEILTNSKLKEIIENLDIQPFDNIFYKGNDFRICITETVLEDPFRKPLGKGSFNKSWKVWSNKLKCWVVLKSAEDFLENPNILDMMKSNENLFPKIYYHDNKIVIQELLWPLVDTPDYNFDDTQEELIIPVIEYCQEWGFSTYYEYEQYLDNTDNDDDYDADWEYDTEWFVDENHYNWGYEILGWKDREQTDPILGNLKNFDPLNRE